MISSQERSELTRVAQEDFRGETDKHLLVGIYEEKQRHSRKSGRTTSSLSKLGDGGWGLNMAEGS